jgi:iron complex transport system ATP-binding protein
VATASEDRLLCDSIAFAYGEREVLSDVSLSLGEGEALALAGPNGSGKTTLLRLLAGAIKPKEGDVRIGPASLSSLPSKQRARLIAVVPQQVDPNLTFTVEAMVAMGRTPYQSLFGGYSRQDREAVRAALIATDAADLATRRFSELSGGERQRAIVAMALAQGARYLLLDEPTVHLDLQHQYEVLELLRRLRVDRGVGLLAVMHDLNLAALYFDRLAILEDGRLVADGSSHEVIRSEDLARIFRAPLSVVNHPSSGAPQVLLRPGEG